VALVTVRDVAVAAPMLLFDDVISVKPEMVKGIKVLVVPFNDILSTTVLFFFYSKHRV
jgi:hypothetical protein